MIAYEKVQSFQECNVGYKYNGRTVPRRSTATYSLGGAPQQHEPKQQHEISKLFIIVVPGRAVGAMQTLLLLATLLAILILCLLRLESV